MSLPYRYGVTGVFVNDEGLVLACQRADHPEGLQLPQGGIEKDETGIAAVCREMKEELGTDKFFISAASDTVVCYDFPRRLDVPITRKYQGQCHVWFKLRFHDGVQPDLSCSDHELRGYCWVTCNELLRQTISWKTDAYRRGLQLLKLLPP